MVNEALTIVSKVDDASTILFFAIDFFAPLVPLLRLDR